MAKAGLLEAQSPVVQERTPVGRMPETGGGSCPGMIAWLGHLPWPATPSSEGGQGDEWAAYVALDTYNEDVPRDHLPGASPRVTECP